MGLLITAQISWIRAEFGGRTHPPVIGLRPTIRFQRDVGKWLSLAWDVEIAELDIDLQTMCGTAALAFSGGASPDMQNIKEGELIELLDAYRVIGVGKIIHISNSYAS